MESNDQWIHVQYCLLLDVLIGFDVSSDTLIDVGKDGNTGQVGATFFGPLVDRDTAVPLWMSPDGQNVTIICPVACYNFVWGRFGGDFPSTKARKAK